MGLLLLNGVRGVFRRPTGALRSITKMVLCISSIAYDFFRGL